jgi:hypothetical protein
MRQQRTGHAPPGVDAVSQPSVADSDPAQHACPVSTHPPATIPRQRRRFHPGPPRRDRSEGPESVCSASPTIHLPADEPRRAQRQGPPHTTPPSRCPGGRPPAPLVRRRGEPRPAAAMLVQAPGEQPTQPTERRPNFTPMISPGAGAARRRAGPCPTIPSQHCEHPQARCATPQGRCQFGHWGLDQITVTHVAQAGAGVSIQRLRGVLDRRCVRVSPDRGVEPVDRLLSTVPIAWVRRCSGLLVPFVVASRWR